VLRHDLFYRLSGVDLHVPPLRTRREDILELAVYFLARYRGVRPFELSQAAADGLLVYDWPGNVRELERLIEGVVALAQTDRIELDDLPPLLRGGYADVLLPSLVARETMRAWGSRYARLVLERCGQNKRRACRLLDISYHTLQAYLRFPCDEGATAEPPPPPAWPRRSPQEVEAPAICRVAEAPPGEVLCGTPCEFGRVDVEG
jgi:transcriptional regulator with PAS, ATPase and Fis domain